MDRLPLELDMYNLNFLSFLSFFFPFFHFPPYVFIELRLFFVHLSSHQCDGSGRPKAAFGSLETMISEADHNREASSELDPSLEGDASLQSEKYFPDVLASLGCVAT